MRAEMATQTTSPQRRRWPIVLGVIAGVLIVAVAIGLFVLDGILTSQAHAQAAKLSTQLGRPVTIDSVATKLFSGLAVRVKGISVGAGPGEKLPLAQIEQIEVRAALLKALRTKGEEIEVNSAELQGLTVNVIKLADGKTNLEHLQEKLAEEPKKPAEPPKDDKPADLSRIQVDHFAILEGHVSFLDETGGAEKKLEIKHLSVVVNDLKAGKPLEVVVKAAVLATKENFELKLHAAPLPASLIPTPDTVVIKISPAIDLAPLAPFVPASVGLEGGHLDADFSAQLGAAVPGGEGKTSVKGAVHALGLKFAGAEGGKALDVSLETDLDGDAAKGDVDIKQLKLDLGPAGITGSGKAMGLKGKTPSVQGLQIVSHDLDPEKLAALYPPLRKQLKGQISGPIGLTLHGAGSQAKQALELRVDLTPVRLAIAETMTKAAGAKMVLLAHAKGAAAADGELAFDVDLDLAGVDLRPGKSVNKSPGEVLSILLEGVKSGSATDTKVALSSFAIKILDQAITGSASVELAGKQPHTTTKFEASAHSALLDLDKLLIPTKGPKPKSKPLDPKTFAGLSGHAGVKIDKLRTEKQDLTNIVADITLQEDDLQIKTATLQAFAGKVDASGTHLKLAHPDQPLHVQVKLADIELAQGLAMVSDKKVMGGKFNGDVNFDAKGDDPAILKKTAAGLIQGKILDGTFFGKDLIASVSGPLASKLPFGLAGKTGQGGSTSLGKELPFGLQLANGEALLKAPIKINSPEAAVSLGGGLTLEGILKLAGQADLSPQTISTLTGGKAKVDAPLPIKFKLGGPAWKPELTDVDVGDALKVIVRGAAAGAIGRVLGGAAGEKASAIIAGGADKAKAEAQKAAQAQIDAQRSKAEAAAKAQADEQKKKLEDEAKNRLKGLFGK